MNRFWVHCNSIKSCKHQIEMFKMSEDFNQFGGAQSNALQRNFKNSSQKKNRPDEHSFAARYKSTERLLDCNIHINFLLQRIKWILANGQVDLHGNWILCDTTRNDALAISPQSNGYTHVSIGPKRLHIFALALSIGQQTGPWTYLRRNVHTRCGISVRWCRS